VKKERERDKSRVAICYIVADHLKPFMVQSLRDHDQAQGERFDSTWGHNKKMLLLILFLVSIDRNYVTEIGTLLFSRKYVT
jgi:hypothetical protein